MIGLAEQLKRLGQLARNVRDASLRLEATDPRSLFAAEVAEWVDCATAIIGGAAIEESLVSLAEALVEANAAPVSAIEAVTQRIEVPSNEELMAELAQHAGAGQGR